MRTRECGPGFELNLETPYPDVKWRKFKLGPAPGILLAKIYYKKKSSIQETKNVKKKKKKIIIIIKINNILRMQFLQIMPKLTFLSTVPMQN